MSPPTADDDSRQLADYLTDHGPTQGRELRCFLGWGIDQFWAAVDEPLGGWFRLTLDGWALTDRGQMEGPAIRMA